MVVQGLQGESTDPQHKEIIKVVLYPRRKKHIQGKNKSTLSSFTDYMPQILSSSMADTAGKGENPLQSMLFFLSSSSF